MSRIASPLMAGMNLTTEERESLIRETRGPMALGVIFSFWGLSVIAVSLRLFVRFKVIKKPGLDDWMIAVSEAFCTVSIFFISRQVHCGDGRHLLVLSLQQADMIAKMNFIAVLHWTFAITGTKVSILIQYLRLFKLPKMVRAIWMMLIIVIAGGTATLVVVLTACIPLEALWKTSVRSEAKCLDQRLFWQFQSGFEVGTCWAMAAFMLPPFWKLQMPKQKKIGLMVLLGLSSSACIVSILRMKSAFDALPKNANEVHDFTWTGIFTSVYAAAELLTGIVCCSLPALMPLRSYLSPRRWRAARPALVRPGIAGLRQRRFEDNKEPIARPVELELQRNNDRAGMGGDLEETSSREGITALTSTAQDSSIQSSTLYSSSEARSLEINALAVLQPAMHRDLWQAHFLSPPNRACGG
ncbi:hypothetical protein B0J12DRAFT_783828 [Macrophomina phaseolina]|uniref:Rhodopsin domain-containing protein n=1 Tax=Macrophomina phaseolina TaxID=35725 RepID=A0ABQ8GJB7_9PEZI|nr:hypothetical protein B0J12DRAFT_783828 [Macrophomina phaseolina]